MEENVKFYKESFQKMRKEASLSVIEDIKNNKLLMIRHQRGINKGYINFPGGKKEESEREEIHRKDGRKEREKEVSLQLF